MKYFPITVIDNFFNDPDKVRDLALKCNYGPSPTGDWPGQRTELLHIVDENFYKNFCLKIISIFYDTNYHNVNMECRAYFQKITSLDNNPKSNKNKGWIHADDQIFAGIIYLNPEISFDKGTSIYHTKSNFDQKEIYNLSKAKHRFYLKNDDSNYDECFTKLSSYFDETINVKHVYNRLVLIDGTSWHAAQNFYNKNNSRLTLVFFINKLELPNAISPIDRIKKIKI